MKMIWRNWDTMSWFVPCGVILLIWNNSETKLFLSAEENLLKVLILSCVCCSICIYQLLWAADFWGHELKKSHINVQQKKKLIQCLFILINSFLRCDCHWIWSCSLLWWKKMFRNGILSLDGLSELRVEEASQRINVLITGAKTHSIDECILLQISPIVAARRTHA